MGFSVSGSFAIIVLASFIAFGMVYPAAANGFERVTDAVGATHDDDLERQNTAIEIVQVDYQAGQLDVNVTNNGSSTLSINDTDLVVDNVYYAPEELDVHRVVGNPDSELWLPGETLFFRASIPDAPNRTKVVTEYGVADSEVVP